MYSLLDICIRNIVVNKIKIINIPEELIELFDHQHHKSKYCDVINEIINTVERWKGIENNTHHAYTLKIYNRRQIEYEWEWYTKEQDW